MLVDQALRFVFGVLLKKKCEVVRHLDEFSSIIDNQLSHHRISIIYSDGGGEYTSDEFKAPFTARGITQKFTNADSPEENQLAEKANEYVFNKVRANPALSGLPIFL